VISLSPTKLAESVARTVSKSNASFDIYSLLTGRDRDRRLDVVATVIGIRSHA